MTYIDTDKIKAEIERLKEWQPIATPSLDKLLSFLDNQEQDAPTPPGIEEEKNKKGWLDYGLVMSEIGLHRYNQNDRIRETKEKVKDVMRQISPAHLAILTRHSEAVGAEIVCCCLQAYCKDFMFTQDEVKEIIEKED